VHFSRLRLTGFKSFVEPSELLIEPGLTGIVGPNGCGKSNVVEALRWVMGESSARQMRGRDMDDVIFSGSATRPPRNHATVSVLLDNAARTAPTAYNDVSEIEVSRRIDRGGGSIYRVNGRDVRARDVQLLFADETTGARSTALVSQGQIGALVAAKPSQRRGLLEEAAGITGLHSRRHEAELRLRGAETNLERLDDVMGALDSQLQGLKRQARQANRYRRLSDHIRKAEAQVLYGRWRSTQDAMVAAEAALNDAERTVASLEREAAAAVGEQANAAAGLPPLREAEATAGAKLHRLEVAQVALEAEERRLVEMRSAIETRLGQIDADVEREQALARDAEEAISRLESETTAIVSAQAGEEEAGQAANAARADAAEAVAALEVEVDTLTARLAEAEARRASLAGQVNELGARVERLRARIAGVEAEFAASDDGARNGSAVAETDAAVTTARAAVESLRDAADTADAGRVACQAAEARAREALQAADTALATLRAEGSALLQVMGGDTSGKWATLIDEVTVKTGMETAMGAALGDDLTASTEDGAPMHWRHLPADGDAPPLPNGSTPLSEFVVAPQALERRLTQVGVVSASDGARLCAELAQGQRLVTRDGALWRWDGFTVAPEAVSPAANRLRQKNRLAALDGELSDGEGRRAEAAKTLDDAVAASSRANADEREARAALRRAEEALDTARETNAKAIAAQAAETSRHANLRETTERLAADMAEAAEQHAAALTARDSVALDTDGRANLDRRRSMLAERRAELAERDRIHERLRREATARSERLAAIATELRMWRPRAEGAAHRLAQLAERRAVADGELEALADRPAQIAAERAGLLDLLRAAQDDRKHSSDAVAEAENRLANLDHRLREAEAAVAQAREDRVRREGLQHHAISARDEVARAIADKLGCAPSELAAVAGVEDGVDLPDADHNETRLARLVREREGMGPVNLRAEMEATEVDEQLAALRAERADLEAAIARLRHAIGRLNREGRERLETAFEAINGHFSTLFTQLFGGGRAHLSLVDSDDPLEAGLEIMASPPGKRLQMLSLLSGGEQALTALAMMFAVFLTNPTPICVLDEVDAPLDDANVARFCDLLEEISHTSATRFLLVTHHALTMARMDRLFGVTMSERGVSQLVSVDLYAAEGLKAAG
jgi:chromosome segregation protein